MALEHYLEEEDEGNLLLSDRRRAPPKGPWNHVPGRDELLELASKVEGKIGLALVAILFLGFWLHSGGRSAPGPAQAAPGLKHRGLDNGEELKWAEDTFGLFLKTAVPNLEKANFDCHNFLNKLAQGECEEWAKAFTEKGVFSFNLPHLQGEFSTRQEVLNNFCRDTGAQVRAVRLVWHFPDSGRLSGTALYEVFTQATSPGAALQKARWAQFARLTSEGGGVHIQEFRLYVEAPDDGPLKNAVDTVVQANLKRLNGHDCSGFEAALPAAGTENWVLQSLPTGSSKKDELDEKPREQILAKCKQDVSEDWKGIDFQHGSIEGVFPSMRDREVIVFFHKEKRYKGTIDVTDDPEALIVKLSSEPRAQVHTLYFFNIEGVHLVQEWGWKYGWASHHLR